MTAKTPKTPPKTASNALDTAQGSHTQPQTVSSRAKQTAAKVEANKAAKAATNVKALGKVISVIQTLREISPAMTLNQALVFLEVAKGCEGQLGTAVENLEVRRRTGLGHVTLVHLVAALATIGRTGKGDGLNLIDTAESDTDGRAKSLSLTDKGHNLVEKIIFLVS